MEEGENGGTRAVCHLWARRRQGRAGLQRVQPTIYSTSSRRTRHLTISRAAAFTAAVF